MDLLQITLKCSPDPTSASSFARDVIDVELALLQQAPQRDNNGGTDLQNQILDFQEVQETAIEEEEGEEEEEEEDEEEEVAELPTIQSNAELAESSEFVSPLHNDNRDIRGGQESIRIQPRGDMVRELENVPTETTRVMPILQSIEELAKSMRYKRSFSDSKAPRNRRIMSDNHMASGKSSSRCVVPYIGVDLTPIAMSSKECNTNEIEPWGDVVRVPAETALKELNPSNPHEKKRPKFEGRETEFYNRCNCKKSKCMKLYCDCFATGAYCGESCSCIDCLNKPVHKDEVMSTRKKIESRNPNAFDPKVIKSPASARHKRGCNCRKSKCLQKYCECFQGGVGCSRNCRCEGCNNIFGPRDG